MSLFCIREIVLTNSETTKVKVFVTIRAVDLHSFYADPDPAVFLNVDPDPGPGPALPNLKILSCKKHKRLLKSKKQWMLCKFTFKKFNKLAVISNFLAFFLFFVDKFTLPDLDLGGKMIVDPDPQPWLQCNY